MIFDYKKCYTHAMMLMHACVLCTKEYDGEC